MKYRCLGCGNIFDSKKMVEYCPKKINSDGDTCGCLVIMVNDNQAIYAEIYSDAISEKAGE